MKEVKMIGTKARFNYPVEFVTLPEYSARRGQVVTITRLLAASECDQTEGDPMYEIVAVDGWKGTAWESELDAIDSQD